MELVRDEWSKSDYSDFKNFLKTYEDIEYKKFHSSLVPNISSFIGIRLPILRDISKQILKGNYRSFLLQSKSDIYEEKMIEGLVIAGMKDSFADILPLFSDYIKTIDNWAICDTVSTSMKVIRKNRTIAYEYIKQLLISDKEYELRTAFILLLSHYIIDEYIEAIFLHCDTVKNNEYYLKMAVAWLLATVYAKHPEECMKYLKRCDLDDWTFNKTIQKCIESRRVSDTDKILLKNMKRKIIKRIK